MKYFFQIDIVTDPPLSDESAAVFWMYEPDGINFENNTTRLFFSDLSDQKIESIKVELNLLVDSGVIEKFDLNVAKEEQINWNEEWQKGLKVLKAGTKFAIKPTFVDYEPSEGEIVIEIDPKMSFGTGEHETTQLILGLLEKYGNNRDFVLDAGAGTAILAIGAIKLGSKKRSLLTMMTGASKMELRMLSLIMFRMWLRSGFAKQRTFLNQILT